MRSNLWARSRVRARPSLITLLLAAIHRICHPGPKTAVADWYERSILRPLWGLAPERFTSQAFWDSFEQIRTSPADDRGEEDELDQAQSRLLGVWQQKQVLSRRLLAYDTTNFYTWWPSNNTRTELAQRWHT